MCCLLPYAASLERLLFRGAYRFLWVAVSLIISLDYPQADCKKILFDLYLPVCDVVSLVGVGDVDGVTLDDN